MTARISYFAWAAAMMVAAGPSLAAADPAAAPAAPAVHHPVHHRHARHLGHARTSASIQPLPPAVATPPAAGPAPVPNEAVNAPIDNPTPETNAGPSVFQLHYPPQGDGYVTGSSPQAMDDRNAAKATGVEVKVPLPQ